MEAFAEFGVFSCSIIAHQFYEFKILQSDKVAGINRNNDFQAYFAGLAVSLQNVRGWQKTQEAAFSLVCFIFVGRRSLNFEKFVRLLVQKVYQNFTVGLYSNIN